MTRGVLDKIETEGDFALGLGIGIGLFIALFAVAIALFVIEQSRPQPLPPGRDTAPRVSAVPRATAVVLPAEASNEAPATRAPR